MLSDAVIVALLSFAGTILGSLLGIITSNKLTQYRIEQLEKSVNQIKNSQDRINELEAHNKVQDEKIHHLEKIVGG